MHGRRLPWHRRDPAAYRRLVRDVEGAFPGLFFEERGERVVVAGEFVVANEGRVLDRYEIEVELPSDGPTTGIPVVREVGGRIPRTPDRHVNSDGSACLMVPDEFWYRNPDGLDLISFLRGPVLHYFISQSIVEHGETWPAGERAHGIAGVLQFYASLLGTDNPGRIAAFLRMAAAKKMRAHWPCPCGSGRRATCCHGERIEHLRNRLPRNTIRMAEVSVRGLLPTLTRR